MRNIRALGILLLVLVGILLLLHASDSLRPPAPPPAAKDGRTSALEVAPEVPPADVPAPPSEPGRKPLPVRITGRVRGADPVEALSASLRVTAVGLAGRSPEGEVRGESAVDGRFDLDVSALLAEKVEVAEFEVRADHPDFLPAVVRVPAVKGRREYEVEITLVRAAIVTGRVVDERGGPVENAGVTIYGFRDGRPGRDPVERTVTGPDGTYRLRAVGNDTHLVVAAGEGLRPAQVSVSPAVGRGSVAPDLVLNGGVEIAGVVRESGHPAAGATVVAYLEKLDRTLYAGGHQLTWSADRFENARIRATTDAGGRYVLRGLARGKYRVRPGPPPPADPWVDLRRFPRVEVAAPALGVDFDLATSRLEIELRADGKPLAGKSHMIVVHGTFYAVQTAPDGTTSVLCDPEAELTVEVEHDGFEDHEEKIVAPGGGRTRRTVIELEPLRPRPTLVVVLHPPPGDDPVRKAGFGVFKVEGTDFEKTFPELRQDLQSEDGRFRLRNLEPGRRRVVVRPGGEYYGGKGYFLEEAFEVELPEAGEVFREIALRSGGRLRLSARDENGRFLEAELKVRDGIGAELPFDIASRERGIASFGGQRLQKGVCELVRALPPARYEVEFKLDGYRTVVESVEVEAGKTAEIRAVLERSR